MMYRGHKVPHPLELPRINDAEKGDVRTSPNYHRGREHLSPRKEALRTPTPPREVKTESNECVWPGTEQSDYDSAEYLTSLREGPKNFVLFFLSFVL